jgi:hypothetical protein
MDFVFVGYSATINGNAVKVNRAEESISKRESFMLSYAQGEQGC